MAPFNKLWPGGFGIEKPLQAQFLQLILDQSREGAREAREAIAMQV